MNFSLMSPPPAAPPTGLSIGTAVYLVAFRHWWRHQSDGDRRCRDCRLPWPCDSLRLHDGILGELCRRGSEQALRDAAATRRSTPSVDLR